MKNSEELVRLKKVLLNDKIRIPNGMISILKNDLSKFMSGYFSVVENSLRLNIEVDGSGMYTVFVEIKAEGIKEIKIITP